MKLLLLILIGLAVVASEVSDEIIEKWENKISGFKDKCLTAHGADKEIIHNINKHLKFEDHDEGTKCFYKCIYKECGLFDSNGQFNAGKFVQTYPWVTHKSASKCAAKTESEHDDNCEKSFQMAKCILTDLAA
ncbi:hypothetical protein PPYR_01747 [Photinus pyralis]|uniref:Uncharacterized protein n=2 Tax=Photinus pyralis TaxID=7054 RepID=A0A5N4B588_PHOPY|nr:general odorant-binding protein 57c-like [Photinus pyralis]KAB0804777.1 hypothetical protein PPYR_01747 [Photinus pyralis]